MTSPAEPPARRRSSRYASTVWGTAVVAYVVAVLNRSSFGVAGIEAADRYDIGASTLATFVVLQLVVYAGLQVPVGILVDRFGPRRLIATGAAVMSLGQLAIALSTTAELALAARVLIGVGDALTFVSVIRLLPAWFALRRVPLVTQLTGMLGLLGQLAAAVPLALVLHGRGWTTAFVGASVLGLLVAVAVLVVVRDSPDPHAPPRRRPRPPADAPPVSAPVGVHDLGTPTLRRPGTWLGFWVHLVAAYSTNAMVLLWAFPFMVSAQGRSPAEVSALLTVNVVAALLAGPVVGHVSGHHPERRLRLVTVMVIGIGLAWAGLLLPPEPLPLWALAVFMATIAVGVPVGLVGLDIARSYNPRERMGTATGVANSGGFVGALLTMLAIGVVLDVRAEGAPGMAQSLADYRVAFACAGVTWVVGLVGLVVSARAVRRQR